LIRESGEKTIMPWTGLERRSDLKAAMEGFAPANQPIRKYLSLLRHSPSLTSNSFLIVAVESEKEGRLVNDFENPDQSPSSEKPASDAIPSDSDENVDPRKIGMAKYVPAVAVLMIVHGVLMFVAGFIVIGVMVFVPQIVHQNENQQQLQRQQNPNAPQITKEGMTALLYVTYGAVSAFLFLIGVLDIYAGARNYGYRNRVLGVISIVANMGSILFFVCLPLSIGLLIFGMIIYLSPETDRAFRWRSSHPQQP
jgi:hypothetical protein